MPAEDVGDLDQSGPNSLRQRRSHSFFSEICSPYVQHLRPSLRPVLLWRRKSAGQSLSASRIRAKFSDHLLEVHGPFISPWLLPTRRKRLTHKGERRIVGTGWRLDSIGPLASISRFQGICSESAGREFHLIKRIYQTHVWDTVRPHWGDFQGRGGTVTRGAQRWQWHGTLPPRLRCGWSRASTTPAPLGLTTVR